MPTDAQIAKTTYREAEPMRACRNCGRWKFRPGKSVRQKRCPLMQANIELHYTCDAWRPIA